MDLPEEPYNIVMTSILIKFLSWWIPKRRYTHWHCSFWELLVAAFLFMFLPTITYDILYPDTSYEQELSDISQDSSNENFQTEEPNIEHPVVRLIQTRNWTLIGLGFYMACILAPINEEFLFRGCLQNWVQGGMTLFCRKWFPSDIKCSRFLISLVSITIPALVFALVHYRSEETGKMSIEDVAHNITNACVAWTLFTGICLTYLFSVRGLRFRDIYGSLREIPSLVCSGVKWIWIAIPVIEISIVVNFIQAVSDTHLVLDPIPLFPLAIVFGFLYYRTQSTLPSIVLHFLFNFTSLCLTFLFIEL